LSEHVWAKVYLELPTDPKLVGRSAHDCYLWVCLILIAKPNDGVIPPWQAQAKYLSKYARISLKEVVATLVYFEDVAMLASTPDGGFVLPRFTKRQGSSDPTAAERQQRKRDRARDSHGDVTRDSHDTRGREEADRTPNGVLTEAEADKSANADQRIPELFEIYRLSIHPVAKFIPAARDKIRTRLKTFTFEQLCAAVKHFSQDSWEMEHNATRGAAWFFDSDKRIEQYVHMKPRDGVLQTQSAVAPDGRVYNPITQFPNGMFRKVQY
jgi:hypothetical protein